MSTIKIILIAGLLGLAVYFLARHDTYQVSASKKILGLLFVCFAILSVLFPDLVNDIAKALGIGRGADLLLYLLVIAFLFSVLNIYMYNRKTSREITVLARKVSLLEARAKQKKSNRTQVSS